MRCPHHAAVRATAVEGERCTTWSPSARVFGGHGKAGASMARPPRISWRTHRRARQRQVRPLPDTAVGRATRRTSIRTFRVAGAAQIALGAGGPRPMTLVQCLISLSARRSGPAPVAGVSPRRYPGLDDALLREGGPGTMRSHLPQAPGPAHGATFPLAAPATVVALILSDVVGNPYGSDRLRTHCCLTSTFADGPWIAGALRSA
jgi:glycerate-2-kinase